jgi:ribonuclease HI
MKEGMKKQWLLENKKEGKRKEERRKVKKKHLVT